MLLRAVVGLLIASTVALAAHRARALDSGGVWSAIAVGTVAVAAGWAWGGLLVAYFVVSVLLSKLRASEKERRTGGVVAKGGARDAKQVLVNGGLFAAFALLAARPGLSPIDPAIAGAFALGALAASAADTWATEIGSLASKPPRSILTGKSVPAGTSGGVNFIGMLAMLAGATFVALAAGLDLVAAPMVAVIVGGVTGALADSVVGATLQDRRWCDSCQMGTERLVHGCGTPTRHAAGLTIMDNDAVNLIATVVGGTVAALIAAA